MDCYLRVSMTLVVLLLTSGCVHVDPPFYANMIPLKVSPSIVKSEKTLMIGEVKGGGKTDPMSHAEIENADFRKALIDALRLSQTFGSITTEVNADSDYTLDVEIIAQALKPGMWAITSLFVRYTLIDDKRGGEVWAENIYSEYDGHPEGIQYIARVAAMKASLLATEGAARDNLTQLVEKLSVFIGQQTSKP